MGAGHRLRTQSQWPMGQHCHTHPLQALKTGSNGDRPAGGEATAVYARGLVLFEIVVTVLRPACMWLLALNARLPSSSKQLITVTLYAELVVSVHVHFAR